MDLFTTLWEQEWHERLETLKGSAMSELLECIELALAGQNAGADAIARDAVRELRRRVCRP